MTEQQNDLQAELSDAWADFIQSVNDFTKAVQQCKADGMTPAEIQAQISAGIPESDRAAYAQFYPMLSMLIATI